MERVHHYCLSSRQLHRKDGRIKNPKLNQIPKKHTRYGMRIHGQSLFTPNHRIFNKNLKTLIQT